MEFCGILRRPALQAAAGPSSDEPDGVFLRLRRRRPWVCRRWLVRRRSRVGVGSKLEERMEMLSSHAVKCRVQSCVIERGAGVGQPTRGLLLPQRTVV